MPHVRNAMVLVGQLMPSVQWLVTMYTLKKTLLQSHAVSLQWPAAVQEAHAHDMLNQLAAFHLDACPVP